MAAITGSQYQQIAQEVADAYASALDVSTALYDAVYLIVGMNEIEPEVDLLSTYWTTYQSVDEAFSDPSLYIAAVRTTNQHVIRQTEYNTIDDFLDGEGITVPENWAMLSEQAGYSISNANIA